MADIKIKLTAAELIYLARQTEGTILPGISDPFQVLNQAEKTKLTVDVEESLQNLGYFHRSFGGKKTIDETLLQIISVCTMFQYYIAYDIQKTHKNMTTERFYFRDGKWVHISGVWNDLTISKISASQVQKYLEDLPSSQCSHADQISLLIPKKDLKQVKWYAKNDQLNDAEQILKNHSSSDISRALLLNGLTSKADLVAITLGMHRQEELAIQNVMVLSRGDDTAEFYQTIDSDDRTLIGLQPASEGIYQPLKEVAEQWVTASL